jgi:hypothetical protein
LQAIRQLIDEAVRLREQIARIDEDDGNVGREAREQMQRHRRLRTEARRQHVLAGEMCDRPFDALLRAQLRELRIHLFERAYAHASRIEGQGGDLGALSHDRAPRSAQAR